MAVTPNVNENPVSGEGYVPGKSYLMPLIWLTSLFFMWGFLTCLNDILIPHLKGVFDLNYTQAMLVQFCFFGAYFIVSIPAGSLVKRIGFKRGIVLGLVIAGLGCLMFYPAAGLRVYGLFLAALFVLAAGITILQVAANPFVTVLGSPETASSRLTLTQAFNSLGTTIAPTFGAFLILSSVPEGASVAEAQAHEATSVQGPYLMLFGALILLAVIFAVLKLPKIVQSPTVSGQVIGASAWSHSHLVLGAVGIFVYVGAEVSIGSFIVNFLGDPNIVGMSERSAGAMLTYYWMGAMVGRFIGAAVMRYLPAGYVLAFNAVVACILVAIAVVSSGTVAMVAILAVGLCNSIMFPTIFSLALRGLGEHTSQGSGILCMAIVGGALVPLAQGALADTIGLQLAFLLPILCYAFIAYYGMVGSKPKTA
ncbi:MAG TPA: sugar MFS transporter [Marinagarivorans sp.]